MSSPDSPTPFAHFQPAITIHQRAKLPEPTVRFVPNTSSRTGFADVDTESRYPAPEIQDAVPLDLVVWSTQIAVAVQVLRQHSGPMLVDACVRT